MKILHIAKNIPNKFKKENDIILVTIAKYKKQYDADVTVIYPLEYVPKSRLLGLMGARYIERIKMSQSFMYDSLHIDVFRYLRLPFRKLANSLVILTGKNVFNAQLTNKLKDERYDVVHCHYLLPDCLVVDALNIKAGMKVVTIRQGDVNNISLLSDNTREYKLYKSCLLTADKLITPNYSIKEYIEKKFNVNVTVVPHGCDIPTDVIINTIETNVINIVTSASLIARKNVDWVIKAINAYNGDMQVILHITGDGPELNKLKAMSSSKINFLGNVSHSQNQTLFSKCDLFLLPSEKETFGRVYIEALSYGLPCIALKDTGLYGYPLQDSMIFVNNYSEFSDSVCRLIDDLELRNEMSKNALYISKKLFSWSNVLQNYNELYQDNNQC
jgi:glycosyltransferase involved in cell wall biosynthesis